MVCKSLCKLGGARSLDRVESFAYDPGYIYALDDNSDPLVFKRLYTLPEKNEQKK